MKDDKEKKFIQAVTLIELTSLINSSLDIREIIRIAVEAAASVVNSETGSLLLLDHETGELFFEVALGEKGEKLKEIRLAKGQGIAGWVVERRESIIVNDVQNDARFYKGADEKSTFSTRNMICVPVQTRNRLYGALQAINSREERFGEEDRNGLEALANHVAIAIENARLFQELKETFYQTVHALAETIEQRDPYTGGHTNRVMDYSMAIGERMGLSVQELETLKLAAILHDVGKIGVRDSVLLKKGRLDQDEFAEMCRHSEYGARILHHISQLHEVIPGVRSHHERYDGKGYPDRLSGPDIPLVARIIAVADTFDAMTSDRPYRKGLSDETAIQELKDHSGSQFDTQVVQNFILAYTEGGRAE